MYVSYQSNLLFFFAEKDDLMNAVKVLLTNIENWCKVEQNGEKKL